MSELTVTQLKTFCKKADFNLEDYHYLNGAYMSPLPMVTEQAGIEGMRRKRIPMHLTKEHFFSYRRLIRERFAQLIHAESSENIAILPSVSYGLSIIANNTPCNDKKNIILVEDEFPSVYYTWEKYCRRHQAELIVIERPVEVENRGSLWSQAIIDAIDENTHVVSVGNIHWQDGSLFDLKRIAEKAHAYGALLVIDATQSVGAIDIDIKQLNPYALLASSYKTLLGPYSMAIGYFSDPLCSGEPLEENWINRNFSDRFAELTHYQDHYRQGAERFDVGESSNFILTPMLAESLKLLIDWDVRKIQQYCQYLTNYLSGKLQAFNIPLIGNRDRGCHYLGIEISQFDPDVLVAELETSRIIASVRGDFMRISLHVYNNIDDCDALIDAFKAVLSRRTHHAKHTDVAEVSE